MGAHPFITSQMLMNIKKSYALFEAHKFELLDVAEAGLMKNDLVGGFARGVILERVDD